MIRRNIQLILCGLFALCSNVHPIMAQDRSYEGTITVNPVRLEQVGDILYIDMDIVLSDVKVKSSRGVDLIPQLVSADHTLQLPRVSLKGREEFLAYERFLTLMSAKGKANYQQPYVVEKVGQKKAGTIEYRYMLPYEAWMADARLDMQRDECGCGETALMDVEPIGEVIPERPLVPYVVTPHMAYIKPQVEDIKWRDVQAECFLDFEVNKVNIRPEYMNNPQELAKLRAMIDELKADPDIEVKSLDIIGYASPEGSLANNKRLSEGRAMALRDYLASKYNFSRSQYRIVFGGENWDGLVKTLQNTDIDNREELLDIIMMNNQDYQTVKLKVKQLHGGIPYQYLLRNVYPKLRVAICKVNYNVKNFNVEEAKEVIKKRPQNLSLNEMFTVANSYPEGSQEFREVFETAVRMYPEDEVANLNAAAAALLRSDSASAERYLNKVHGQKNQPAYDNAMGVLMLLKGDYESAEKYLKNAEAAGVEAAGKNLEELAVKKANAAEIEQKKR